MVKRFQNKISGSRFLLATVAVITVVLWFAAGMLRIDTLLNLAITAVTAYFLVELDTRNSIIRIYSRMITSSFLILTTMTGAFVFDSYVFTALLWTFFFNFLFSSYQDKNAAGRVFYAFLFLGLSSILCIHTLFFLPVLWFCMQSNIMSMGKRTLAASVIGFLLPYWFMGGYLLFTGDVSFFVTHFSKITSFGIPLALNTLDDNALTSFILLASLSIIGIIHYIRNSNKDKIRTRMFCETIIATNLFTILFILLQPYLFINLLPVLVVTTSILISHFIVLTSTRLTNISVIFIIAIVTAATIYNLWIN